MNRVVRRLKAENAALRKRLRSLEGADHRRSLAEARAARAERGAANAVRALDRWMRACVGRRYDHGRMLAVTFYVSEDFGRMTHPEEMAELFRGVAMQAAQAFDQELAAGRTTPPDRDVDPFAFTAHVPPWRSC